MSIPCIFFVLHCQTPRTRIVYMLWNDHPCLYMKEDPLSPLLMYNSNNNGRTSPFYITEYMFY